MNIASFFAIVQIWYLGHNSVCFSILSIFKLKRNIETLIFHTIRNVINLFFTCNQKTSIIVSFIKKISYFCVVENSTICSKFHIYKLKLKRKKLNRKNHFEKCFSISLTKPNFFIFPITNSRSTYKSSLV